MPVGCLGQSFPPEIVQCVHNHGVIPAKAGIHPAMFPRSEQVDDLRMDSGLRRNDTAGRKVREDLGDFRFSKTGLRGSGRAHSLVSGGLSWIGNRIS